jgi:hypothetical protein
MISPRDERHHWQCGGQNVDSLFRCSLSQRVTWHHRHLQGSIFDDQHPKKLI